MSTDTAFALGALALLTPQSATRLRVFLLTLAVFDDLGALLVIATAYTKHVSMPALLIAIGLFAVLVALRFAPGGWRRPASVVVGVGIWIAMFKSGIDPVIAGLAVGLVTSAYPPSREDLERVTELTRSFREQPTPELARSAQQSVLSAISPNERLQYTLHPWTGYVIVPLFALANAGIHLSGGLLSDAVTSPITLGIVVGYVVGKPVGIMLASWIASRPVAPRPAADDQLAGARRRRVRGRDRLHRLAADLEPRVPRTAPRRGEARRARLSDPRAARSPGGCFQVTKRLPAAVRARQISQTAEDLLDLGEDVDPERDHIRGPDGRPGDARRVRRLRVSRTAGRPSRSSASCSQTSGTTSATCGGTCRSTTCTRTPSSRPRPPRRPPRRGSSGRCTKRCSHSDDLSPRAVNRIAQELGLDTDRFWDDIRQHEYGAAGLRGRRQRGRERGVRDAELLHQRPPPLRRLRPGDAHRRRVRRSQPRAPARRRPRPD